MAASWAGLATSGAAVEGGYNGVGQPANQWGRWELAGLVAILSLEAIEPMKPELGQSPRPSLLLVSSGFATSAELAKAALAASEAGSRLSGVVITNPDPADSTAGLLPVQPGEALQFVPPSLDGHISPELARREPN